MKRVTGARVALIVVLGALVLSIAAFGTGYATHKGEEHGNSANANGHVDDAAADAAAAADDADAAVSDAAADAAVGNGNASTKKSDTGTAASGTQTTTTTSTGTQGSGKTNPDPAPSPSRPSTTGDLTCNTNNHVGGSGANSSGYYDSRCDRSAGDHGNGGNGKCAGCTGKADWKNPRGQYQNDHNNGYECDHNSGVGKGNPPHSRCPIRTTTTPPPSGTPPCPPGTCPVGGSSSPVVNPSQTNQPNVCVDNPDTLVDECDKVLGERLGEVEGEEPIRNERGETQPTRGETLPFTGAGVISLLFLGGLMVAGGALVIQRTS